MIMGELKNIGFVFIRNNKMNEKDILKYGTILTDDEMFYFTFCPKEKII